MINSLNEGIKNSKGEFIFWIDADGSMNPELILKMLKELESGFEVIQGSRYIQGGAVKGQNNHESWWQLFFVIKNSKDSYLSAIISRFGNRLLSFILSQKITDYSSGYFGVKRSVFNDKQLYGKFVDYSANFSYSSVIGGLKFKEIPMQLAS